MKRILHVAIVTAAPLAVCAVLTTSKLAAEPIVGRDSLVPPSAATESSQEVTKAVALFQAGNYAGALRLWKTAAKNNADLPPAQVIMAQLFLEANHPKEAQNALEQAIVDDPADPAAYVLMASVAMGNQDVAKAESLYQKAHGLMPKFERSASRKGRLQTAIYSGLAGVAEARKDWARAQKALEEWLKLDTTNAAAMQQVAYCLFQQKNVDGALEKLREAAKADPDTLTPEAILAQFFQRSGDRENAQKWMAAAVTAASKDLKTRLVVGYWALEAGQTEEAGKQAIAAVRIDPKSVQAEFLRGLVAMCQKDFRAAELIFESVVKRSSGDFSASNNLALALIEQDDDSKRRRALEYAEENVQKLPKSASVASSASAASTYGWVLYKLGRLDDAEKALRTAASLERMSVDTAYYTARVAIDRGRKAEAKEVLEGALKNTGLSMFRQEAEELLKQLKK
jgi:tetratricopeptide (TPR) repeat protein